MTATIHKLKIAPLLPDHLAVRSPLVHSCGSLNFNLTKEGDVFCAKCSASVESVVVSDRAAPEVVV
jgi:hypothetical protein